MLLCDEFDYFLDEAIDADEFGDLVEAGADSEPNTVDLLCFLVVLPESVLLGGLEFSDEVERVLTELNEGACELGEYALFKLRGEGVLEFGFVDLFEEELPELEEILGNSFDTDIEVLDEFDEEGAGGG